jgi:hypothetical protein
VPYAADVRPRTLVARTALTAALALVALPGLAGSQVPAQQRAVDAAAFQAVSIVASRNDSTGLAEGPDGAYRSAGFVSPDGRFIEPGEDLVSSADRPSVRLPGVSAVSERKPPRFTLTGEASFYDNGTTAMRLPRGTRVVICGAGGCVERVVSDYGPQKPSRVVDMYRPDFFQVCGCGWWSGITNVTVYVY